MKNNPTELPTWDEFLRPLLECAAAGPILRRTAVLKIADQFHFSKEIRNSRVKSGQTIESTLPIEYYERNQL